MNLSISIQGIDQVSGDLQRVLTKFVSDTTTVLTDNLKSRTPIDTGRARRGWQGRAQGTRATISNTVPYIELLENGRSRQAPNGFVRQAVQATVSTMNAKGKL